MNKKISVSVFLCFIMFVVKGYIYPAEWGKFQMIIPIPDPVQAGEKLVCQIIAVNVGPKDKTWGIGEYSYEMEIYDSEKNYLFKTKRIKGTEEVPSGGSSLVFLSVDIPSSYQGNYFLECCYIYNHSYRYNYLCSFKK